MNNTKELALDKKLIISLTQFVALVGVAVIVPLFHQQMITGSIINATLFLAAVFLGARMAIFVGLIPSVIAFSVGLLPLGLAPMVPFIMISNSVLILVFNLLKDKNYWLAVFSASFLKFLFLLGTSSIVIALLPEKNMVLAIASMMSYPQLLTALAGGVLAYFFLVFLNKNDGDGKISNQNQ
jgi:hypothetical protein